MIDLTERVIILTGASSTVGRAIARQLVYSGAHVVLGYRKRVEPIERLMNEIAPLKGLAMPYSVDVTSRPSVDAMVAETLARFGRIDALVHNAHATIDRQPFLQLTWDDYESQVDVILKGGFNCCQAVLDEMVLRREGKIIFLLNNLLTRPVWGYSTYTSAIAALSGFARDLANEVGELGISVNSVSQGFTLTEKTPHAPPHVQAQLAANTPLRRLATPEDTARAVLFFLSNLSNFITGETLNVDGGYTFGYGGSGLE